MTHTASPALGFRDSPDPDSNLMLPIYSAKVGRPVNLVIVTPSLVGAETHFVDGRTRPHINPAKMCDGCARGIDNRWKGFLGCWDHTRGRLCLAEVTAEAFKKCHGFKEYKDNLRGKVVRLVRNGDSKNARVTASLSLWAGSSAQMPAAFDVQAALKHVWFNHKGDSVTEAEFLAGARPDAGTDGTRQGNLFTPEGPYGR